MSVAHRPPRSSNAADRGELVGTIAGLVVVIPLLGVMGYAAWLLVVRVVL